MSMSEIKVGEYVRTYDGTITKLKETDTFFKFNDYYVYRNWINGTGNREKIKKHSFEPIDLIEEGDVLELREYVDIFSKSEIIGVSDTPMLNTIKESIEKNKIKLISILTYEQFKDKKYKVVE